jgi:hypothetical protein
MKEKYLVKTESEQIVIDWWEVKANSKEEAFEIFNKTINIEEDMSDGYDIQSVYHADFGEPVEIISEKDHEKALKKDGVYYSTITQPFYIEENPNE